MNEWPPLAVLLLSYRRPDEAIRTIDGILAHLRYSGELYWYLADDGSEEEEFDKILGHLRAKCKILGYHNQRFSPNAGVGWNKGLGLCHQFSEFVLVMEDDWELDGRFNANADSTYNININLSYGNLGIDPYVEMLTEREDVGMVRLGGISVGNTVKIIGHNGHHYLQYDRQEAYAFVGGPHIRHGRFTRAYGWYSTGEFNPGELELVMNQSVAAVPGGPQIWRPADIPGWGMFHHIGQKRFR